MTTISKRDGREQPFKKAKIIRAVQAAGGDHELACDVARQVACLLVGREKITVEDLQGIIITNLPGPIATSYEAYKVERDRLRNMREQPNMQAISDYILASKYANWCPNNELLEDWTDCVARNKAMHVTKFPEMAEELDAIYHDFVLPRKVLPAMRSLQFGGKAIEVNNARIYNCWYGRCDNVKFFHRLFFILLSGGGVGYSVQRHHVAKLPAVRHICRQKIKWHEVEDTIEGWGRAVKALTKAYFETGEYVEFDYRKIRPEGAWLKTSAGKAPGHVPLKISLESAREILGQFAGLHLTPFAAHRLACIFAAGVLSGGIRRSSLISLFSPDDQEMLRCKATDNWPNIYPELRMANNSAVLLRSKVTERQFRSLFEFTRRWGEPGFFFTNDLEYGCNPCGEIGLHAPEPRSFQACNLVEVNCATVESPEDFVRRCVAAAVLATVQAKYDELPYLGAQTEKVVRKEALIGVGLCGVMDNGISRRPEVQQAGARAVNETNARIAKIVGVEKAARTTTIKPAGTSSLLLGCVASGIHTHPYRRYFRLITANPNEPAFRHFKSVNPHMCQEKPDHDWIIKFPVEVPSDAVVTSDLSAVEFLDIVFHAYDNWIVPGSVRTDVSPGLTNNISCTVPIQREEEWEAVIKHVWNNRHRIAAQSYLPTYGKKTYDFLPRTPVTEKDEASWNTIVQLYRRVDYLEIDPELFQKGDADRGAACEGGVCET